MAGHGNRSSAVAWCDDDNHSVGSSNNCPGTTLPSDDPVRTPRDEILRADSTGRSDGVQDNQADVSNRADVSSRHAFAPATADATTNDGGITRWGHVRAQPQTSLRGNSCMDTSITRAIRVAKPLLIGVAAGVQLQTLPGGSPEVVGVAPRAVNVGQQPLRGVFAVAETVDRVGQLQHNDRHACIPTVPVPRQVSAALAYHDDARVETSNHTFCVAQALLNNANGGSDDEIEVVLGEAGNGGGHGAEFAALGVARAEWNGPPHISAGALGADGRRTEVVARTYWGGARAEWNGQLFRSP